MLHWAKREARSCVHYPGRRTNAATLAPASCCSAAESNCSTGAGCEEVYGIGCAWCLNRIDDANMGNGRVFKRVQKNVILGFFK
jgi:hypothetical protein